MSFSADARVQVSDQSSQYRNAYGTVKSAADGVNQVRLDGYADTRTVAFNDNQLRTSTQPCPIEYPES